ncbi:hypothetical protein SAY86_001392 [Trapa natans]|uniref:Uncharacterized protein n=1 Tax=Trapa natans TaxID=22666 RepID=A0AAN7MDG4_TRANT|nr:hypothetical protein SAY86_001392 [Trapa natans]
MSKMVVNAYLDGEMAATPGVIKVAVISAKVSFHHGLIPSGKDSRPLVVKFIFWLFYFSNPRGIIGVSKLGIKLTKESIDGIEIEFVELSDLPMINADIEVDGKFRLGPRAPNVLACKAAAAASAGRGLGGGLGQHHIRKTGVFLDVHFINWNWRSG